MAVEGRVKRNAVANIIGQAWSIGLSLGLVPFYIRLLGPEAYGLIGFYSLLQSAFGLADFGLSATMNREMARRRAVPGLAGTARTFVRTLEAGYWVIGLLLGTAVAVGASFIATHWIHPDALSPSTVRHALLAMAVATVLVWPVSLYQGALLGLERQALFNTLRIVSSTVTAAGTIAVLWWVSPTVTAYFSWQIVAGALQVALFASAVWHRLPPSAQPVRWNPRQFRAEWRFAVGMSGVGATSVVLTQLDKIIVSSLQPLATFGYYSVASVVGTGLSVLLTAPVFNAIFPRFSSLIAAEDDAGLRQLYRQASQALATLLFPAAAVIAFFSYELLFVWTNNPELAAAAAPATTLIVIGAALNGATALPFSVLLAKGWVGLSLRLNLVLIALTAPAMLLMTWRFGAMGAASVWVMLNAASLAVLATGLHRRLLRGGAWRGFASDIGWPLLTATLVVGFARAVWSPMVGAHPASRLASLVALAVVGVAALAACALTAPLVRHWLFRIPGALAARRPAGADRA